MPDSQRHDGEARNRGVPAGCVSLVATDVFGAPLGFDEAVAALRTLNLETALSALAMLNAGTSALLEKPRLKDAVGARRIRGLMRFLFDDQHNRPTEGVARGQVGQLFVSVSPQGCAAMTEACLRYCPPDSGRDVSQPSTTPVFAHILLTLQQYLLPASAFTAEIDFANLDERQFALLACNYLGANYVHALGARPTRFYLMFEHEHLGSEMLRRTNCGARVWFDRILGLDPLFFRVLALGLFGKAHAFNIDQPEGRSLVVDFRHFLGNLKPPIASICREILQRSVVDLAEVGRLPAVTTWEGALFRFNYLRRKPLWALRDGRHLMLHRRFFVEKFFEGVLHVLTEAVMARPPRGWPDSAERRVARVRSEFGYVFDDYCRAVARTLFAGPQSWFVFGYEVNGQERDGIVAAHDSVLLLEFVQHPISVVERETGAIGRFLHHLRDNVQKLASVRDEILAGRPVAGRVFATECIVPIVITSDTFPGSHLNAEAFARGLAGAVGADAVEAKESALPVQTLGIEQFEHLGRTKPAERGAEGILQFLRARAADPLERFTASPTCGLAGGSVDLWQEFDQAAERSMMNQTALIFRPETLPPDWHLRWRRSHPPTGETLESPL